MPKHSLVIVSNRLPVSVSKTEDGLEFSASSGGLATAMSSLEHSDKVWVGWPGIASDELTKSDRKEITEKLKEYGCSPVFLTKQEIELFYEGYANDTLWPLFHYFQSTAEYSDDYWNAYDSVNQQFTKAVEKVAQSEAMVWIQDYQLMLMPQLVRDAIPGASIGFFLHIPFPSFEIFRLLPERIKILEGLLGSDVIGFHIYDYGRHFLSSCMRLLGLPSNGGVIHYDERPVKVASYPIGIDFGKFQNQLKRKETKEALTNLDKSYGDIKLIISVDRLDYSKGIPERLEAFRLLLEEHPEYIGKVKLLMIAVPSRTGVKAYKELRDEIEQTVSRINGTYGTVEWAPISYQFQNRPFSEIVALYARADIALVTPIRDGMNLVAKEYIACKNKRPGVLILSEMAGAIDELPDALSINPNNSRYVAESMLQALTMPKREQLKRIDTMRERIKRASVQNWSSEFITDLEVAAGYHDQMLKKRMTTTQRDRILTSCQKASSRLIVLDYDGTLKSLINTPTAIAASPSLRLRWIIKRLTELPNTKVAVVSGRPRSALTGWFLGINVILAAEHGAWTRYDKKWNHVDTNFKKYKKMLKPILERYTERTSGSEIEEKDYALVWHYVNVPPELAFNRASELQTELSEVLEADDVGVYEGNKIIEIKPTTISKAKVAETLIELYPSEFVFCAGDDYTDEDMFRVLDKYGVTVKVGTGDTRARYQVEGVSDILQILDDMTKSAPSRALRISLPSVSIPKRKK